MKDNLFTLQDAQTFKAFLEDLPKHNDADEYWNTVTERDAFAKKFVGILVSYALTNPISPLPNSSGYTSGNLSKFGETINMSEGAATKRIILYNQMTWLSVVNACIDYADNDQEQKSHELFSKRIGDMTGYEFQQFLKKMNLSIFKEA